MDNRNTGDIDYASVLSNKAYVYQNSTKTFTVFMNLRYPKRNQFYSCVTGKVKLYIYDFARGKGDQAVHATFNLDLPDVYMLYERAKEGHMPSPLWKSKIVGPQCRGKASLQGSVRHSSFRFRILKAETEGRHRHGSLTSRTAMPER